MRNMDQSLSAHLVRTKAQLLARLRKIAAENGTPLLPEDDAMRVAEAYRTANDPIAALIDAEQSADQGVALARALVMQGSQEIMTPHYRAIARARAGALVALEGFREMCAGIGELRGLHQAYAPLYDVEPIADLALLLVPDALSRMPAVASALSGAAEEEEAMVMNMTRALSKAFGPTAIAELIDDGGDRTDRRPMDRVRRRLEALENWSNKGHEVAFFPLGWQRPQSG